MSFSPFSFQLVDVRLVREPGGSFGFTVAGDITSGGCYVKHLVAAPKAQFGTLFPGDKLLRVSFVFCFLSQVFPLIDLPFVTRK